jgi:hypothetical protein
LYKSLNFKSSIFDKLFKTSKRCMHHVMSVFTKFLGIKIFPAQYIGCCSSHATTAGTKFPVYRSIFTYSRLCLGTAAKRACILLCRYIYIGSTFNNKVKTQLYGLNISRRFSIICENVRLLNVLAKFLVNANIYQTAERMLI